MSGKISVGVIRYVGGTQLEVAEIALVLVRFDHGASVIINANHGIMRVSDEARYKN